MSKAFYPLALCLLIALSTLTGKAQNRMARQDADLEQTDQAKPISLVRELNLTPAQIRQIRQSRSQMQSMKTDLQAARQRLQAANEELDRALYASSDNDAEIQARLRDVHAAQLDVLKKRVASEQIVTRVLTPQQLDRFRELRQQQKANRKAKLGNGLGKNPGLNANPRQQQRRLNRLANRQQRALNP